MAISKRYYISTSFIQYRDKILVLKRSNKVGSFQGKYGGVSGFIELPHHLKVTKNSPSTYKRFALKQAYIEIKEELGLNATDVQLLQKGKLFIAESKTQPEYRWYVYPFLFKLITNPKKISLNWESISYKFVNPGELLLYETVPQLPFVLYQFFLPDNIVNKIKNIYEDNSSGSFEIAQEVINIFKTIHRKGFSQNLKLLYEVIKNLKPMAVIYNIVKLVKKGENIRDIEKELKNQQKQLISKAKQIINPFDVIIVYSYSSTLFEIISSIPSLSVYAPDEPHSLRLLQKLQQRKIKTEVFSSISLCSLPHNAKAIISCDAVLPQKSIINAKGTQEFIKMMKKRDIKTYCFVQKMKVLTYSDFEILKKRLTTDFEVIPCKNNIDYLIVSP